MRDSLFSRDKLTQRQKKSLANPTACFPLVLDTTAGRKVTPQGGTADHTRETYLEGGRERKREMGGRPNRGERGERRGTTEPEHPSHAVAAQPHFATSILPARLHSHSVDPFTEGMSHMPPSSSSSLLPSRRIPSSSSNPRTLLLRTPRGSCLRQSRQFSFYLSRRPSFSSIQARQRTLPPLSRSLFLSRSFVHSLPKCPSFSPSLLCDAGR